MLAKSASCPGSLSSSGQVRLLVRTCMPCSMGKICASWTRSSPMYRKKPGKIAIRWNDLAAFPRLRSINFLGQKKKKLNCSAFFSQCSCKKKGWRSCVFEPFFAPCLLRGIRCSIVLTISACHAESTGSVPGAGVLKPIPPQTECQGTEALTRRCLG